MAQSKVKEPEQAPFLFISKAVRLSVTFKFCIMRTSQYFALLLILFTKAAIGQDTIIQTDGSQIIAQVLEVGTTEIKYKKYQNMQTSPIYDIEKYKVSMIKYADGTQDAFTNSAPSQNTNTVYSPYPNYYTGNINNSNMDVTGAYISLGAMVSPVNMYQGSVINNYWSSLYSRENSKGYSIEEEHTTPFNTVQSFLFCSFKRKNG